MMTPKILFFTAVLFVSAAVGYPANEIDWGKGRPGVRVVTNAPSRAEFDALVSGYSQYATWAANASNALRAVAITGPQSNVIASAGVHTNRTDNPHAVTAAQVGAPSIEALYTLMATSQIERLYCPSSATNWMEITPSNVVWSVAINSGGGWHFVASSGLIFEGSATTVYLEAGDYSLPQLTYPLTSMVVTPSGANADLTIDTGAGKIFFGFEYWICSGITDWGATTYTLVPFSLPPYYGDATLEYRGAITNRIPYYLQTNLTPSETWSYTDQTNWMATGNAGQLWATDLAADAATTVLNNHIAPILASPYSPWTTNLWAELGTATVSYACGNQPSLVCTNATVITVDSTGFGTSGVGRVALSLYSGTNSVTFLTNAVDYSTTPTLVTNAWNTILFRRVSADRWKGAQLQ